MPCYVTGSEIGDLELFAKEDREALKASNAEVLRLTRLLCEACKLLHGSKATMSKDLQNWSRKHDNQDRKRGRK